MNVSEIEDTTKEYIKLDLPTGPLCNGQELLKLIEVYRKAWEVSHWDGWRSLETNPHEIRDLVAELFELTTN